MKQPTIGAIFMRVTDLERSIDFYTTQLGFKLRDTEVWDGTRAANLFTGKDLLLTLIEEDDVQVLQYPLYNLVTENVREMYTNLKQRGYSVTELEQWDSERNHHLYFDVSDPDGHPVNIIEIKPILAESAK